MQEDTPRTPSATEPDAAAHADSGVYPDQIPGGRYHIVDRLSTSAIGAVYKALDTVLDRPVAVKCVRLNTPLAEQSSDELRERFVREARIAARLQHPNIVTIHDIVATPDRGYIIMEFIEGRTLESLVGSEGRLPLSTAIKILAQLSSALDYAHDRNVIHRDVKPSNILVSPSMYVWVTDFGIAKSELSTNLTMAGGVLGTPDYMSPEQAKGEDVDARSDLFSLGCILFEAVVGEKPFRSPSLTGVLLSIINDEPVFPLNWRTLGLPTQLKPILHHALEKARDQRYGSGEELMADLHAIPAEAVTAADAAAGAAADQAAREQPVVEDSAEASESRVDELAAETKVSEPGPSENAAASKAEAHAHSPSEDRATPAEEAKTPEDEPEADKEAEPVTAKTDDGNEEPAEDEPVAETTEAKADEQEAQTVPESVEEAESVGTDETSESTNDSTQAAEPVSNDGKTSAEPEPSGTTTEAKAEEADDDASSQEVTATDGEPEEPAAAAQETAAPSEAEAKADAPADADAEDADAKVGEADDPADAVDAATAPERPAVTDEQIQSLKDESQVLHLSPTLSSDLQGAEISPEEGFLLSRIDGASRPNDIISVSPMTEADTVRALMDLLDKGLIRLGGVTREPAVAPEPTPLPPKPAPKPRPPAGPGPEVIADVDRLIALADAKDYPALLGLSWDAPESKRKSAYLKIVAKYHPDKFPTADKGFRDKLSKLCASASEAVTDFETCAAVEKAKEAKSAPPVNGRPMSSNAGEPTRFDKRKHARELYDRALTAYDRADYWDAIQLGRQAIEIDEQVAEFYGLLGRALMQNKKWRKEAADNFLKANQLEPNNIEFIGLLGAIYESEGLTTRASSLLDKAKELDPDYELPDLDEVDVSTD